jgi:hypothetical protein
MTSKGWSKADHQNLFEVFNLLTLNSDALITGSGVVEYEKRGHRQHNTINPSG